MIYDFILGKKLSESSNEQLYLNRFEKGDQLNTLEVLDILIDELKTYSSNSENVPLVIGNALNELVSLKEQNGGENVEFKIRQLLSMVSYNDYEIYLVRRPDLTTLNLKDAVRAYMIDKNDDFFPTLSRVGTGSSLTFDIIQEANISDVVMTFLKEFNFMGIVKSNIDYDEKIRQYDLLSKTNSGWAYRTLKIEEFMNDLGYKFFILIK